jgi:Kef-type K+ transport system membrane component KefB
MFLFIYIVVGLCLGPSLLNVSLPESLFTVGSFGFLFVAGLELNVARLREDLSLSVRVAAGAFLVPFVVGFLYAWFALTSDWHGSAVIAVALAISALPVVVQILKDLGMYGTRWGHTIIAAATLCDITAWLIFTFMLPSADRGRWVVSHLPVAFFFVGLVASSSVARREKLLRGMLVSSRLFFGPLFFIGVGMKIHWQQSFDYTQFALILLLASGTKMLGVYMSARGIAVPRAEAMVLSIVLNARGAMEILFCAIALQLGLIDGRLFTSLTLMAVASSLMAAPLVKLTQKFVVSTAPTR